MPKTPAHGGTVLPEFARVFVADFSVNTTLPQMLELKLLKLHVALDARIRPSARSSPDSSSNKRSTMLVVRTSRSRPSATFEGMVIFLPTGGLVGAAFPCSLSAVVTALNRWKHGFSDAVES